MCRVLCGLRCRARPPPSLTLTPVPLCSLPTPSLSLFPTSPSLPFALHSLSPPPSLPPSLHVCRMIINRFWFCLCVCAVSFFFSSSLSFPLFPSPPSLARSFYRHAHPHPTTLFFFPSPSETAVGLSGYPACFISLWESFRWASYFTTCLLGLVQILGVALFLLYKGSITSS